MANNIIGNDGWKIINNRVFKSVPDYTTPSVFQIGQDNSTPSFSDTSLTKRVPISSITVDIISDCSVTTGWSTTGDNATATTNTTTYKIGGGQTDNTSLNLGKDGTSSTSFYYEKTTTSFDGTSKWAFVWVYFLDQTPTIDTLAATDGLTFRLGSDSSNYYQYTYDRADIEVGWNLFSLNLSSPETTTGSPAIAALDYSYIGFTTNNTSDTITLGNIIMDLWHAATEAEMTASLTSGYPTISETTHEVEYRANIASVEAVGYYINAFALKNTDATKKVFSIAVIDVPESKGIDDEFVIISKFRRDA